jgi:S1-C subfamily serine protease
MKLKLAVPAIAILSCALVAPALAGGDHCAGKSSASAAAVAASKDHCSSTAKSAAWAGAWLERSSSGDLTVAAVASGSPAARSGLRAGDLVLAVNGRDLAAKEGAACMTSAECKVGAAVAYTVQRGKATKVVKVKLEKMPEQATAKFAGREASFDPSLAAVILTSVD